MLEFLNITENFIQKNLVDENYKYVHIKFFAFLSEEKKWKLYNLNIIYLAKILDIKPIFIKSTNNMVIFYESLLEIKDFLNSFKKKDESIIFFIESIEIDVPNLNSAPHHRSLFGENFNLYLIENPKDFRYPFYYEYTAYISRGREAVIPKPIYETSFIINGELFVFEEFLEKQSDSHSISVILPIYSFYFKYNIINENNNSFLKLEWDINSIFKKKFYFTYEVENRIHIIQNNNFKIQLDKKNYYSISFAFREKEGDKHWYYPVKKLEFNLDQKQKGKKKLKKDIVIMDKKLNFIEIDFRDYELAEYNEFKELINNSAYDNKYYRILPILLRCLFENLLYNIFQTSLDANHNEFFYLENQNRPRDFSQLIAIFNILKDKEFKLYHKDSINQNIIDVLKEIQKYGNWTVHEILRQIDNDFADKLKQKVNRALESILVLYKKVRNKNFLITDQGTLDKINKVLNFEDSEKKEIESRYNTENVENKEIPLTEKESSKEIKVDVELINYYIEMLENDEISSMRINEAYKAILKQCSNISYQFEYNKTTLESFTKICSYFNSKLNSVDKELLILILESLRYNTRKTETLKIIKETCYDNLISLFENGERNYLLIIILIECGYYSDIIKTILKAFNNRDLDLLNELGNFLDPNKIKPERIKLLKILNRKIEEFNKQNEKPLIEITEKLIRRLERV